MNEDVYIEERPQRAAPLGIKRLLRESQPVLAGPGRTRPRLKTTSRKRKPQAQAQA